MEQETLYQSIQQENMYGLLCEAEQYFNSLPKDRASCEKYVPSYSTVVSACRVLDGRKLTGMNVEQFRHNHPSWYGEVMSALTEAVDKHGLVLKLNHFE